MIKRRRGKYSRLICLECRDRRIRCELPSECAIPEPGQLLTVKTPCHRCNRLGVPCIVRQTVLGRPSAENGSPPNTNQEIVKQSNVVPRNDVSRVIIELPSRAVPHEQSQAFGNETRLVQKSGIVPPLNITHTDATRGNWDALLVHVPQSTDTVIIIRAIDTLRREKVEKEWFRHLPCRVGYNRALDLSSEAIVAACAFSRGVPKLTATHCYHAMALALHAVQLTLAKSDEYLSDNTLASSALLAHLEGVIKGHGIPTLPHLRGLAAIMSARPPSYPISELAKEIFDFHACDSAIIACVHGISSPYESIPRAYYEDCSIRLARSRLKIIGSECFIRIPRLVALVRSMRTHSPPSESQVGSASVLFKALDSLQDPAAEAVLLQQATFHTTISPIYRENLRFDNVEVFEALTYYWLSRLWLMCLHHHLQRMFFSMDANPNGISEPCSHLLLGFGPDANELVRVVQNVLMCVEYAEKLTLRKHCRLFAQTILTIWGIFIDIPAITTQIAPIQRSAYSNESLLRSINIAIPLKSAFVAEDIDVAATIFVGGPTKGRFAELYGASETSNHI